MNRTSDVRIIRTVTEMQAFADECRRQGKSLGCVPTLGALHRGHASLVDASVQECAVTVTTIFVNPTQFGPNEDFTKYPRTLDDDIALLRQHGCDVAFVPDASEMYPDGNHATSVHVDGVTEILEGAARPGHFDGVATVVTKLFMAVQPDRAYFGQKDLQQTRVILRLVKNLLIPVTIRIMPTVREADGLALSSRNRYLSHAQRAVAPMIYSTLLEGLNRCKGLGNVADIESYMTATLQAIPEASVGYVTILDATSLLPVDHLRHGMSVAIAAAVHIGTTRLIDNVVAEI